MRTLPVVEAQLGGRYEKPKNNFWILGLPLTACFFSATEPLLWISREELPLVHYNGRLTREASRLMVIC